MAAGFDWMTWAVEGVGAAILCIWVIIPAREFGRMFRNIRRQRALEVATPAGGGISPSAPASREDVAAGGTRLAEAKL
jgi:hypothetical protein